MEQIPLHISHNAYTRYFTTLPRERVTSALDELSSSGSSFTLIASYMTSFRAEETVRAAELKAGQMDAVIFVHSACSTGRAADGHPHLGRQCIQEINCSLRVSLVRKEVGGF